VARANQTRLVPNLAPQRSTNTPVGWALPTIRSAPPTSRIRRVPHLEHAAIRHSRLGSVPFRHGTNPAGVQPRSPSVWSRSVGPPVSTSLPQGHGRSPHTQLPVIAVPRPQHGRPTREDHIKRDNSSRTTLKNTVFRSRATWKIKKKRNLIKMIHVYLYRVYTNLEVLGNLQTAVLCAVTQWTRQHGRHRARPGPA
jgi:hypothetical protein